MPTDAEDVVPSEQCGPDLVGLTVVSHRLLLDDVMRALADIAADRTEDADAALARLQQGLAHRHHR